MSVILLVLLGAIFLLFIILFLPVNFSGKVHAADKMSVEGEVTWAGGLVAARLGIKEGKPDFSWQFGPLKSRPCLRSKESKRKKPGRPRRPGEEKQKKSGFRPAAWQKTTAWFLDGRVIGKAISFLRRLARALNLKLRLEGEYGTGDPALTGLLTAALAALKSRCGEWPLRPNFMEALLDIRGEFRGRLIPAELLWLAGCFFLAAPVRRLWWSGIIKSKLNLRRLLKNA